jgi:hypothetical protein
MAKFITNSAGLIAIRLSDVSRVFIRENKDEFCSPDKKFELVVKTGLEEYIFEVSATVDACQAAAGPIMTALEE